MHPDKQVYVVDDDSAMRDSLEFLLSAAGFQITSFVDAEAFLAAQPGLSFGCVLTDVRMPGMDGIELLRRITTASDGLQPVIVMTGHGDVKLAVEAMKLGAFDFLEKPFEDDHLISLVESALSQRDGSSKIKSETAAIEARIATLTQRESQVLQGLIHGKSNKTIARDYDISPRTVEVYRANVMMKMQASNLSELIRLAVRAGMLEV
jgi:two-component system response regulator FixJ